jgi:endogenous inhibitor of DNA gyrase (YacG/DUF329 family)
MTVKCPICKKEVAVGAPEFPFCSQRCRIIDLGNWASEKYSVPVTNPNPSKPEEDED